MMPFALHMLRRNLSENTCIFNLTGFSFRSGISEISGTNWRKRRYSG